MSRISLLGLVGGEAANIVVDPSTLHSKVSLRFAFTNHLPCTVRNVSAGIPSMTTSCGVELRSAHGRFKTNTVMSVEFVAHGDAVLGSDWLLSNSTTIADGVLLDPPETAVAMDSLQREHAWVSGELVY